MGVLRSKMSELTSELSSMKSQIAAATEEQSTFLTYDKRWKLVKEWVAKSPKSLFIFANMARRSWPFVARYFVKQQGFIQKMKTVNKVIVNI